MLFTRNENCLNTITDRVRIAQLSCFLTFEEMIGSILSCRIVPGGKATCLENQKKKFWAPAFLTSTKNLGWAMFQIKMNVVLPFQHGATTVYVHGNFRIQNGFYSERTRHSIIIAASFTRLSTRLPPLLRMPAFPKPEILSFPSGQFVPESLFSILIPSWNNLDMLQFCVLSIRENSKYPHQIIVHVNEGSDGTLEWVKKEGLDYTYSETNAGVCYSVNAMATLARTENLLYINDDMYVCMGWDAALWKVATSYSHRLWYLSGTMIEPSHSKSECVASPHDFGRDTTTFMRSELDTFAGKIKRKDWFGASWPPSLMPKELFDKVGGYSEEFSPGMYSDPDFSMKLWQAGVREFRGVGSSLVYHFMSKSTARVKKNNGRKQFAVKWGIPSSFFYKEYLQIGRHYRKEKILTAPGMLPHLIARIKALWIRIR